MADHFGNAVTPIYQGLLKTAFEGGFAEVCAEYGAPFKTLGIGFANGRVYQRVVPLVGANRTMPAPPAAAVWLLSRIHPEFRRREKSAKRTLATRPWNDVVRDWNATTRDERIARNLEVQAEDPAGFDDAGLADHLDRAYANTADGYRLHFVLHASDLGPLGLLLVTADKWGLSSSEIALAMAGSSPASAAPRAALAEIGRLVEASGTTPATLDDVRAISPQAAVALDDYLRTHGWRVFSGYDIDALTLMELPDLVLRSIIGSTGPAPEASVAGDAALARLREQVPEADRAEFDDLVTEARASYGMRDDNGPYNAEWPIGLLRRGHLEAGKRLAASGRLAERDHVLELELAETQAMLRGAPGPTAVEAAGRAARRRAVGQIPCPETFGPPEAPPPVEALPANIGMFSRVVLRVIDEISSVKGKADLHGTGVGTEAYRGRVCTARTPEDALDHLEPGDILVAPLTTPAYNAVLPMAGALVVEEGGALSHAAVMARELGIPAVIGIAGVLDVVKDGDEIEVDPVAGRILLLSS
jgi:pyruvate,water dikinase